MSDERWKDENWVDPFEAEAKRYLERMQQTPYKERLAKKIRDGWFIMPLASWLTHRMTFEEVEAKISADVKINGMSGYIASLRKDLVARYKQEWKDHLSMVEEDDEWWAFRSPPESWKMLAGRAGIALVRNGIVVDFEVTVMN